MGDFTTVQIEVREWRFPNMSKPREQINRKARNCKRIRKLIVHEEKNHNCRKITELSNELNSHSSISIITCTLGASHQTELNSLHWKVIEASWSSNTDHQKSNSDFDDVMSLIIIHKGSSNCSQVTCTLKKN